MIETLKDILSTEARLLTFRLSRQGFLELGREHFWFGIICTWVVGAGRYWDDPGAKLVQHLGLGSVIYIFLLSTFVWLIILPLGPKEWAYSKVLTFVSLTSVPAILYAIPVERFVSLQAARSINAWFLAAVAGWRVVLLIVFLRRYSQLGALRIIVASFLPLTIIVVTLTALNLERAVFDIMGGLRDDSGTANDAAYMVLNILTLFSLLAFVPLLLCYVGMVLLGFFKKNREIGGSEEI